MNSKDIYNPKHFVELINQLKQMESLFKGMEDNDIVMRISKHDVLVRGELNDLDIIWRRFLKERQELIDIAQLIDKHIDDEKYINSEDARKVLERKIELANNLKVELKSLFLFSDILFNKLVLLVRAVANPKRGIEYRSYTSFLKSLRKLDGSTPESAWEYLSSFNEIPQVVAKQFPK